MKRYISLILWTAALVVASVSCDKHGLGLDDRIDYQYGKALKHDLIVLGGKLENPYKTENMKKALAAAYPTKAGRVDVKTTNLYVRFLPRDDAEYQSLLDMGVELVDHPVDFEILVDGDYYQDPSVGEDNYTWQYAVVPRDFVFPDIRHEVLDECFLAENSPATKADGLDWEYIEEVSYRLTGNGNMLSAADEEEDCVVANASVKAATKSAPSGRITIVDPDANGGKPVGVSGVKVSCNAFVRFSSCYTDRDGYYTMPKTFSSKLRYRLVFKNEIGFAIGVNLILVPASVSTLGKASASGIDITVTQESEDKLFRRCVANNAAYDYIKRCSADDMNITPPPGDLRIWIFPFLDCSSAVMLHHGTVTGEGAIAKFLGVYAKLIQYFAPDITIGTKGKNTYKEIYSAVTHEMSHSSHFAKAGVGYWNKFIGYMLSEYVKNQTVYGDGMSEDAGYCEVGEMWAYYMQSRMYKERYGGSMPTFGNSYWFHPQIFRALDERGLSRSKIFKVMDGSVVSRKTLSAALVKAYPEKRTTIETIFNRYGE